MRKAARWYGRILLPIAFVSLSVLSMIRPVKAMELTIKLSDEFRKNWEEKK
jgi:hypothetical protein